MRRHTLIVAAAWMLTAAAPSFATILMTTQTSGLSENSSSTTDLLQTAFGSFIGGIELDGRPTQREPFMRNGLAEATIGGGDYRYVAGAGQYVEWALNLGVGNGGFDITRIDTYEVWDTGRCGQNYSVLVSFVGAPTTYFTLISAAASPGGFVIGSSGVLDLVSFTNNSGGVLDNGTIQATGVARIRFNFANADTYGANMYREIDLIGSATIPEPATLTLLALGGLGLWRRRRARA